VQAATSNMQLTLLVACLGSVHCHRDETKSRHCKGQPSMGQIAQLAKDAHQMLGLATEELRTSKENVVGNVEFRASGDQFAKGSGEHQGSARRNVMRTIQHKAGKVAKYNSLGEDMSRKSRRVRLHNSSEETTDALERDRDLSQTDLDIDTTTTSDVERALDTLDLDVDTTTSSDVERKLDTLQTDPGVDTTTSSDVEDYDRDTATTTDTTDDTIDELSLENEIDKDSVSTTSLIDDRPRGDITPMDPMSIGHFHDLPSKQTQLEKAHEQLQQVATQANELAMKTYDNINAYQQAVEQLHDPVHEVAEQVHELHQKFEENIRSGEEERLQAWQNLDEELKNAGVTGDNS